MSAIYFLIVNNSGAIVNNFVNKMSITAELLTISRVIVDNLKVIDILLTMHCQ